MAAASAVELAEDHEMESNMMNYPRYHHQRHFPTAHNYYNRRAYAPYYVSQAQAICVMIIMNQ